VRRETSAGGVVFRRDGGRLLVLLIRDAHGNWGFPKGHVERGEDPAATALREVAEETAVDAVEIVAPAGTIEWSFRSHGTRIRKTCHFFAMATEQARTRPQRTEGITTCRWATPADARRMLTYENARDVLDVARAAFAGAAAPA
jgi:diadenosine hexaphosphate hydrolase (ATP-forming)